MNHITNLTKYTANFIDELVCSGLRHVVISPGSRSTPLAVLFAAHKKVRDWIHVDERAAAFFALGIAKETKQPVALVCTSGTAAANYFPAIAEAYYGRVPLIILTADRPHELRDIGASQTMDQIHMYGNFVKESFEMASPAADESMLRYVRNRAARAMTIARTENYGPVHVNFPFREPLMPNVALEDLWETNVEKSYNSTYIGHKHLSAEQVQTIVSSIKEKPNGLLVCGPQTDEALAPAIIALSEKLNIPILADPLSQLRTGAHAKDTIITTYDTIFKSETMRQRLKPDYIIRFGAMPVSKHYSFFVQEHREALQIVVEHDDAVREPTNHATEYVFSNSVAFCEDLVAGLPDHPKDRSWLNKWQDSEQIVIDEINDDSEREITEGKAVAQLLEKLPHESRVFVGNSMPIRDVDTFLRRLDKKITIYGNRGLSGIDGNIATALGIAAASNERVYMMIGDLSFYHDLTSLQFAKQYDLPITILLINNDGGGIFSFLPQAEDKTYFEHLFGTPLQLDFRHAVNMFHGTYLLASNKEEYEAILPDALEKDGLVVLEVRTDREKNVRWHRKLWESITRRLINDEKISDDR